MMKQRSLRGGACPLGLTISTQNGCNPLVLIHFSWLLSFSSSLLFLVCNQGAGRGLTWLSRCSVAPSCPAMSVRLNWNRAMPDQTRQGFTAYLESYEPHTPVSFSIYNLSCVFSCVCMSVCPVNFVSISSLFKAAWSSLRIQTGWGVCT